MSKIARPDAEWTQNEFCPECDDTMPFDCVIVEGDTSSYCCFCGWENQLFAMTESDDGGGWD